MNAQEVTPVIKSVKARVDAVFLLIFDTISFILYNYANSVRLLRRLWVMYVFLIRFSRALSCE